MRYNENTVPTIEKGTVFFMKRWILIAVVLSLAMMAGCRSSAELPDFSGELSRKVSIRYADQTSTGYLERTTAGEGRFTVETPELLSGMVFQWSDSKLQVSFKGLNYSISGEAFPEAAPVWVLLRSLDTALRKDALQIQSKGKDAWICVGQGEDGAIRLEWDPESREIRKISVPSLDFEAEFEIHPKTGFVSSER